MATIVKMKPKESSKALAEPVHAASNWMPPPSSVEEAAALLGASITRINDVHVYRTTAPPTGLHSSFSTVNPVPCSELYVRLASLTNILQSHLESDKDITLEAAPSIIPLLHKLFNISSSLAISPILLHSSSTTIPVNPLQSIAGTSTSTPKKKKSSSHNGSPTRSKNLQVPPVRITSPLCSQPIRHLWVKCLTLAHRLSPTHALPSTNPHVLLAPYFQAASSHPRSAKSAGGARVAALAVLASIFHDDKLGARYIRPMLGEIITLCLTGLRSSGATDVVHRLHSVKCALGAIMAWRDTPSPIVKKDEGTFISMNLIEDRVLAECLRLLRKGADDKYPEVRRATAELASVLSSVSIMEEPRASRRDHNVLMFLDDMMAVCLRNLDDESVGVSVMWGEALARCICTAVEFNLKSNKTHVETSGGTHSGKNDLTSKIKAFQEARKAVATIGSGACINLDSAMIFLVEKFKKARGEGALRMGGSHSMGGRHVQVGIGLALIQLCRLQLEAGGIGSSAETDCMDHVDALKILMKMVDVSPDQDDNDWTMISQSLSDLDDSIMVDATTTPKRKSSNPKPTGVGGFLKNMGDKINDNVQRTPSDASLARLGTNRVIRQGLLENMSETMQLSILIELVTQSKPRQVDDGAPIFNRHQLQVAMIEISHLVTTLGEACASCLDELLPVLQFCLSHSDHGLRFEAAVAFQAVAVAFPSAGRKYIMTMVGEVQVHQDEVLALGATSSQLKSPPTTPQKQRNRRRHGQNNKETIETKNSDIEESLNHQYAIHGNALVLSMILRVMPRLPGGLPAELLDIIIAVADNLVSCQGNANLLKNNPGALVTCVRAGYNIISGALTMGAKTTIPHLQKVFGIWSRSASLIDEKKNRLEPSSSISCLEPFVTSILVFLRKCSGLLLTVPDALNRTIQILEKIFPIILGYSQSKNGDSMSFASNRLDSAKASIIEAFAWLPPGSFPTISNSIFSFASHQIQLETKNGFTCTLLENMLEREDDILNARSSTRTERYGQTGHALVEDSVAILNSKCIGPSEREAVLHILVETNKSGRSKDDGSRYAPTPLHEVGNWTEPPIPSRSSKERLLNSSIHIFAATFGLQDGHQQTSALKMFDEMLESKLASRQLKQHAKNISAALLLCFKLLPSSEAFEEGLSKSHSSWVPLASKIFITMLPIPENNVRRASAEGLGLLASLDSSGGTLQSSILRALEQLMVIEFTDISAQQKPHMPTPTSTSAGCLLTFACIQRSSPSKLLNDEEEGLSDTGTKFGGAMPTMIMMTRLLPYMATQDGEDDSNISRTYALHSFSLLLSYSKIIESPSVSIEERKHVLSKAVEAVESNFHVSWATNDTEADIRNLENEKASFEPAFLAALVRLMTYLVPRLSLLGRDGGSVASRFSSMVTLMVEHSRFHTFVVSESLNFLNCLSMHKKILSNKCLSVTGTGDTSLAITSIATSVFEAQRVVTLKSKRCDSVTGCMGSVACATAVVTSLHELTKKFSTAMFDEIMSSQIVSNLIALLERTLGSIQYAFSPSFRSLASPQRSETAWKDSERLLRAVQSFLMYLFCREMRVANSDTRRTLRWLMLSKALVSGDIDELDSEISSYEKGAIDIASGVFSLSGPCRWQVRLGLTRLACAAVDHISAASLCEEGHKQFFAFILPHVGSLVGVACAVAVATSDQSELLAYQKAGLQLLYSLIKAFSSFVDQTDPDAKLLDEHISQIIPSIKHALAYDMDEAEDSIDTEGARELFLLGCECLQLLAKDGFIPDVNAFKRLLKTVLPSKDALSLSSLPKDGEINKNLGALYMKPTSFVDNRTSILLPRIGSIWALADIYMSGEMGLLKPKYFDVIKSELGGIEHALAINSSALSIDSCRLKGISAEKSSTKPFNLKSGLAFPNLQDIDNVTKDALIRSCPSMACFGLALILNLLEDESNGSARFDDLILWATKLVDVILVEFFGCIKLDLSLSRNELSMVSTSETCATCLLVLRKVANAPVELMSATDTRNVLCSIFKIIKFRGILTEDEDIQREEKSNKDTMISSPHFSSSAILQACSYVKTVCKLEGIDEIGIDFVLNGVLTPLVDIEDIEHDVFLKEVTNTAILNSLVQSALYLLENGNFQMELIKSLLDYSLKILALVNKSTDSELKTSFRELFRFCMSRDAVSEKERLHCIEKMAQNGYWDIWQHCVSSDPTLVSSSMGFILDALSENSNQARQIDALAAIANVIKGDTEFVPSVIGSIGPKVLELFQLYGASQLHGAKNRTIACATCMKIVMFTFQYLSTLEDKKSGEVMFLLTVFQVLVPIISYNGLPSELKSNPGSDPALGRMSAQFFVHVLRTSPASFKECMMALNPDVRTVLETSVRADMSGYANHAAPTKKKLNLSSFKKK